MPLNQGTNGGSVGYGWAALMEQVDSVGFPATEQAARQIADGAALHDARLSRGGYATGQTLSGAADFLRDNGWIPGCRWAYTHEEVIDCLCAYGPILLGIQWFESMYNPDERGIVAVNGPSVGGHCILADGYIPAEDAMKMGLGPSELIRFVPSFGRGYGKGGRGYLRVMDLAFLFLPDNQGEGIVPTNMQATEHLEGWRAFMARPIVRSLTSPFRRD